MSKFSELFKVFEKSIGQNLENDPNDITNIKNKLASLGRYQDDHKSGYIDAELDNSIRSYQRDRHLKSDGVVNPGGETEATLIGEIIRPNDTNIQTANVGAAIPWIIRNSPKAIKAGKNVWDAWRAISPSERQDEVDESCWRVYQLDGDRCRRLSKQGKKKEAERCWAQAAEDYSECLKNK